jgi:hypothetical protein
MSCPVPLGVPRREVKSRGGETSECDDAIRRPEVETAIEVLEDFLHLDEPEKRLEVLTRAVTKKETAIEKRRNGSMLDWMPVTQASMDALKASPSYRYGGGIAQFKAW